MIEIQGVTIRKHPIDGVSLYEVELKNVQLNSTDNILGRVGAGHEIVRNVTDFARFLVGAACLGLLKQLFARTVNYCIHTRRFGNALSDHLSIKARLSTIETQIYTMESMVYLTAGIVDSYQTPDIGCESALTKIFCTETLRNGANECLDIMGMSAYEGVVGDETVHQNAVLINLLMNMLTSNEVLRLQVATSCILQAGIEFSDQVVKHRNPLMYPSFIFKQFLINRRLVRKPNFFYSLIMLSNF